MEILQRPGNIVSLCEKFEVPNTYTDEERSALLEQRFNIAKKRYFPDWTDSWWDTHIPETKINTQIVEWYTHMPQEYLIIYSSK